ncbi:hypothetical protein H5410_056622 [Solanum commersonii]|uniref:Uncharacterized protein n=1 Tax=Solanum commersonii TaxID=4109 RepID=A0A9J5WN76_SOLCO|nr:hypothetical protein H5410_056622 [Solanum commersonii]
METNMASRLITSRGKVINYEPKVINQVYDLLNHDIKAFTNKDCNLIGNVFWKFKMHDSMSLFVLSLIMELRKHAEVEVLLGDTWVEPKNPIFPLKICGEDMVVKSKRERWTPANEPLPTSRPDEDEDESVTWSDDDGDEDSGATKTDGED